VDEQRCCPFSDRDLPTAEVVSPAAQAEVVLAALGGGNIGVSPAAQAKVASTEATTKPARPDTARHGATRADLGKTPGPCYPARDSPFGSNAIPAFDETIRR
jgi:hypothetical protein